MLLKRSRRTLALEHAMADLVLNNQILCCAKIVRPSMIIIELTAVHGVLGHTRSNNNPKFIAFTYPRYV